MQKSWHFTLPALSILASTYASANPSLKTVRVLRDEYGRQRVVSTSSTGIDSERKLSIQEYPQFIIEHQPISDARIIELSSTDHSEIQTWLAKHQISELGTPSAEVAADEVRTLVNSGPSSNRIDLVFMGDGYTVNEKEKFFADIQRLVNDMFIGKTFTSYLPVFNVHAVFRPSNVTGIGRGSAIDTAYGLYREGETLRAIFPSKTSAIRESCSRAPGCDYPVVIANDPYYGGLGGEFAISTASPTSGSVVLRHELGHNFGRVGEEYDGGGYFGANSSSSAMSPKWKAWATDRGNLRGEPMVARFIDWPWHKLDRGAFTARISSDGNYSKTWIRLSASGIETSDTLAIKLDDQLIDFRSPNRTDRSFVNIGLPGLNQGTHTLTFNERVADHNNWLSSLTVHEYASDFHDEPGYVGAFPNFDENLRVIGYRPTNEGCLMRDMLYENFCAICQENNWSHFFEKINLIDEAAATRLGSEIHAQIKTLALGQFRTSTDQVPEERIQVKWFLNGNEITEARDQVDLILPGTSTGSTLEAEVRLVSREIKSIDVVNRKKLSL